MKSNHNGDNGHQLSHSILRSTLSFAAMVFFLIGLTSCSSSDSIELPKTFLQNFIAKHETMVDASLVDFYIKEEQAQVAQLVDNSINASKAKGDLESLQKATFDFSNMNLELVDKKEDYINDEPKSFLKIAIKGSYSMHLQNNTKTIPANDVIILEKVGDGWKVTETINPWS